MQHQSVSSSQNHTHCSTSLQSGTEARAAHNQPVDNQLLSRSSPFKTASGNSQSSSSRTHCRWQPHDLGVPSTKHLPRHTHIHIHTHRQSKPSTPHQSTQSEVATPTAAHSNVPGSQQSGDLCGIKAGLSAPSKNQLPTGLCTPPQLKSQGLRHALSQSQSRLQLESHVQLHVCASVPPMSASCTRCIAMVHCHGLWKSDCDHQRLTVVPCIGSYVSAAIGWPLDQL